MERRGIRRLGGALAGMAILGVLGCALPELSKLWLEGDATSLRTRPAGAPRASLLSRPPLLVLALDGIDRDLLYDMLRRGELPRLAELLSADTSASEPRFPHAYFDARLLSTLPSSTFAAWVTAFTGVPPAVHGATGNEFFVRETRRFAAPIPVTFDDPQPVVDCYTEGYADDLVRAPSVYERMRAQDPWLLVWSAMQHFHRGADRLMMTDRAILVNAFRAVAEESLRKLAENETSMDVYETLDREVVEAVVDELEKADGPVPDVLTVYLFGADMFAHVATQGPDPARRLYLQRALEPRFAELRAALVARDALRDRFVVVTSDHGHTEVMRDDAHALTTNDETDPPAVLTRSGWRVRPFRLELTDDEQDFQAVLAYQGAMAFVYLADRSTCPSAGERCAWEKPPRYREDVLAVAEAFDRANRNGELVPEMQGVLDLILARRPRPYAEVDEPFQVYVGHGRLVPIATWLRRHPHPRYVALARRLADLAVGPLGERAGDVVLVAHNGDRDRPEERFYFASRNRSWHGSPSRKDGEIPLIVAHPQRSSAEIGAVVERALGADAAQQRVSDVLLALRYGESGAHIAAQTGRSSPAPAPPR